MDTGIYLNPKGDLLFVVTRENGFRVKGERLVPAKSIKRLYAQTIACNNKEKFSRYIDLKGESLNQVLKEDLKECTKIYIKDLPLYVGWPYKTYKFSELLKGGS